MGTEGLRDANTSATLQQVEERCPYAPSRVAAAGKQVLACKILLAVAVVDLRATAQFRPVEGAETQDQQRANLKRGPPVFFANA